MAGGFSIPERCAMIISRSLIHQRRPVLFATNTNSPRTRSISRNAAVSISRDEKDELMKEASSLTKSLYRTCIRSVRVIRYGNDNDEREFAQLERKRLKSLEQQSSATDSRLGMLSMLPPVDREDELRSRAEYYLQYAREQFVQESDCLHYLSEDHIARYVSHLRRGEEHRRWLLTDMKFEDPYRERFDNGRLKLLEEKAMQLFGSNESSTPTDVDDESAIEDAEDEDDDDDDDDDMAPGLPSWYENPRNP